MQLKYGPEFFNCQKFTKIKMKLSVVATTAVTLLGPARAIEL